VTLVAAQTLVTGEEVLSPGWVRVTGGLVEATGSGPVDADVEYPLVVPGFVDLHVHGGAGAGYESADPRPALEHHRAHGTTTGLASLVAAPEAELVRSIETLSELGVGVHLEGPWLSPARPGAHDARFLRDPDRRELRRLLAAGDVRMITVAPELPGALALIEDIVAAGVIAAVGHTDADYDTTRQAVEAGATVGTHLFNAERPIHHREPGPIPALLADPRVTVELIADGVHLHPGMLPFVVDAAGAGRVALVTDAMAATGMPDGAYRLGALAVDVTEGVARVAGSGAIAGSTATMDQLFRTALKTFGPLTATRLTSVNPARVLGRGDIGALLAGRRADLLGLTVEGELLAVPAGV
jgi:N-acetylglucosamine-6-phosphate deacetylase